MTQERNMGAAHREETGLICAPAEPMRIGGGPVEDAVRKVLSKRRPHAARTVLRERPGPVPQHQGDRADERDETPDPDQPTLRLRQGVHDAPARDRAAIYPGLRASR